MGAAHPTQKSVALLSCMNDEGRIEDGLPELVLGSRGYDNYLGHLPVGAGDDAFRAAIMLRHARKASGAGLDVASGLWAVDALHNYRRMRPTVLRQYLEMAGAPPHVYEDFLRLCPGAIAPERT